MSADTSCAFLRLFIAIPIPQAVRQAIGRAQGQLKRAAAPGAIRWTRPEQFHVTLKFLGDVPSAQAADVEHAVAAVCAGYPTMKLSACGIDYFPGTQKPRVIWVGADDGGGQLSELHRRLDAALQPFAPTEKPERFNGHVTLGRFKPGRPAGVERLLKRAAGLQERKFGDWQAKTVEVVRSELTSDGARHTPLASFPLAE